MQIDNNSKTSSIMKKQNVSIRLFYIDRSRFKTRKEANIIARIVGEKEGISDVWYITPKGDNELIDYFHLIENQISLDLINGRYLKQWIYVFEYNLYKSNRKTSLFKEKSNADRS